MLLLHPAGCQLDVERGVAMGSPQAAQQADAGVGVEQSNLKGVLGSVVGRILRIAVALQIQAADGEAQEAVVGAQHKGLAYVGLACVGGVGFGQGDRVMGCVSAGSRHRTRAFPLVSPS